jgi:hypothetical protein
MALRNYAWLWGAHHFRLELVERPGLLDQLLHHVWLAARHIENSLSYYFAPNTHLLGEAFGLLVTGCLVPEFAESVRWRETGIAILQQEVGRQIHRDGTHRELSTSYHLYATDFYLQGCWIAWLTDHAIPDSISQTAARLAVRLGELTPSSGVLPQLNDCDGGRLTGLAPGPLDARSTLLAAEWLLNIPSQLACSEPIWGEHLWIRQLLKPGAGRNLGRVPARREPCRSDDNAPSADGYETAADRFDSGLVTHRNPSGDFLLFRCGPFGYLDCGHSHDGQLGIVLHLAGHAVLVDGGCGAYTQCLELRNRFRSATGRNTVLINGHSPSVPDGWFTWQHSTQGQLLAVERAADRFACRGTHTGYTERCGFHIRLEREVALEDSGTCIVVDRWEAAQPVVITTCWTLAPDLRFDEAAGGWIRPSGGPTWCGAWYRSPAAELAPECAVVSGPGQWLKLRHRAVEYSGSYGSLSTSQQLVATTPAQCTGDLTTIITRLGQDELQRVVTQRIERDPVACGRPDWMSEGRQSV